MQDHIKSMTEVCDELSAIGDPVNEEDCVVLFWPVYLSATTFL
jgi:hypothetical protein